MTTTKKPDPRIAQLEADLATYKGFMHIVHQKARNNAEVADVLFALIRKYKKQLKEEAHRE